MKKQKQMDLLRFITSGSVDDGKSTLIGRLMYDTKSIFEDQLEAMEQSSRKRGDEHVNLAFLTDGLKAEREQGITIDVAYRYFATPKRKFIMADTPGHVEYTRNMVTGASTANLAIVLIDARHGIVEQTRRHTYIAALLGIKHIIVAINKMDLVGFKRETFENIKADYLKFSASLSDTDAKSDVAGSAGKKTSAGDTGDNSHGIDFHFIPISALSGDNVVNPSSRMPWYAGKTVLDTLETVEIISDQNFIDGRFPVQRVIRPQSAEHPDFRGYAGRVEGGIFRPGDSVVVLPSGVRTKIDKIFKYKTDLAEALPSESVTITLADNVGISRGDMIVNIENGAEASSLPAVSQDIDLVINWFNDNALKGGGSYTLKHATRETKALVKAIQYKVDIHTLARVPAEGDGGVVGVEKNDIAKITLRTAKPLFYDSYKKNRVTGSVILIDEFTNETVAAGMIDG